MQHLICEAEAPRSPLKISCNTCWTRFTALKINVYAKRSRGPLTSTKQSVPRLHRQMSAHTKTRTIVGRAGQRSRMHSYPPPYSYCVCVWMAAISELREGGERGNTWGREWSLCWGCVSSKKPHISLAPLTSCRTFNGAYQRPISDMRAHRLCHAQNVHRSQKAKKYIFTVN